VAEARERWREDQPSFDPAHLVFITGGSSPIHRDETGTSTKMARTRGRARRGTRLVGLVPHGHWKITTFVAGLRCAAITAPFVIDHPMDGEIFLTGDAMGRAARTRHHRRGDNRRSAPCHSRMT